MKREIRDKERKLFKQSMKMRNLDLSKTNWEQAQEIRKEQDEVWKKHLFYKKFLEATNKNGKDNKKV